MKQNLIDKLKFDQNGLIPVITQDAYSNFVLMQAFMNKEALELTLNTSKAHYFSRSRNAIWLKGETSGNFQDVVSINTDCDYDSILMKVVQTGGACHTGNRSCFFNRIHEFKEIADISIIQKVIEKVKNRAENPIEGSYTNYLLDKGKNKICKKIGEEATEIVIAAMEGNTNEIHSECADFIYHMVVLLQDSNTDFNGILKVLTQRYKV